MKRRMYFLFPDAVCTASAVDNLIQVRVDRRHMHAIARPGVALGSLPRATARQRSDLLHHLERLWWNTNLALFFIALSGLLAAAVLNAPGWALAMAAVMTVTLVTGLINTCLPDVGLDELRDALRHGEVLLLVDVSTQRVAEIEAYLHAHHPEVAVGGVSWTIERFGM